MAIRTEKKKSQLRDKAFPVYPEGVQAFDPSIKGIGIKGLHPSLSLDQDQKLKRAPLGFDAEGLYIEYIKLKNFCLSGLYDDTNLDIEEILKVFKSAKPFLDYINRAIEYSRENGSGFS